MKRKEQYCIDLHHTAGILKATYADRATQERFLDSVRACLSSTNSYIDWTINGRSVLIQKNEILRCEAYVKQSKVRR